MEQPPGHRATLRDALSRIVLIALGVGMALGTAELLLRAFPNRVPREVRVSPPVRRVQSHVDETYEVRLSSGDLFYWMEGAIAPLTPEQDRVVARVHMVTDDDGFRNPPPELSRYDIVALGDSFTRASGVATPWPEKLSHWAGMDVINLGEAGAGPQQAVDLLRQFGLDKQPQWVILAYFGGNDLYDAAAYEQAVPFILPRLGRYVLTGSREAWHDVSPNGAQAVVESSYRYPITMRIDDIEMEIAFFSPYISWLSVSREMIASSENYRIVRDAILTALELSEEVDARFVLVYVPSKEHLYLEYVDRAESATHVFADVPTVAQDEAGFLQFNSQPATLDLTLQHMDDQAELLADFADARGMAYLNLTPIFREAAGSGVELYYPFDTHWNQHGHNLAAEAIAAYLAGQAPVTIGEGLSE